MPEVQLCVLCRQRSVDPAFRPFCSARCQLADLGRWLSGDYRVDGHEAGRHGLDDEPADDEGGRARH